MTKTFKVGDKVRWIGPNGSDAERARKDNRYLGVIVASQGVDIWRITFPALDLTKPYPGTSLELVHSLKARTIARDLSLTPMAKTLMLHLEKHKTISPAEAKAVYGMPKIARQIWELRQDGIDIRTELRHDPRGQRYARYSLSA